LKQIQRKKIQLSDCARWHIDFARVEIEGLYRAVEPQEEQDLAYMRVLRQESSRGKGVGESSISRAVGSQPLSTYDLTGTGSMTAYLKSTLCPLTKRGKVEVQVRLSGGCTRWSTVRLGRESRDLWQIHARFYGLAKRVSYSLQEFTQSNL